MLICGIAASRTEGHRNGIPSRADRLLNPNIANEREDLRAHLYNKYGPRGARMADDPNSHLMQAGRAVGIHFNNKRNVYPTIKVRV